MFFVGDFVHRKDNDGWYYIAVTQSGDPVGSVRLEFASGDDAGWIMPHLLESAEDGLNGADYPEHIPHYE